MGLVYFRRFLSFVIVSLVCVLQAHAQIPGGGGLLERFFHLSTTTIGTKQCATNTGAPIEYQSYSDYPFLPFLDPTMGPTAVVKNNSFTVRLFVYIPGPFKQGTVTLENVKYNGNSIPGSMPTEHFDTDDSILYTFDINIGPAPNYIYAGNLEVNLHTSEIVDGMEVEGHSGTSFRLYTIYASPKEPQAIPWVRVLDDACTWAENKNDIYFVRGFITLGFYNSGYIEYENNAPHYSSHANPTDTQQNAFPVFKLVSFLRDTSISRFSRPGNCYDVSNYLAVCFAAVGTNEGKVYYRYKVNSGSFNVNSMTLIGREKDYGLLGWNNHQMTEIENGLIYDSCLKLSVNPFPYPPSPAYGWELDSPYWHLDKKDSQGQYIYDDQNYRISVGIVKNRQGVNAAMYDPADFSSVASVSVSLKKDINNEYE